MSLKKGEKEKKIAVVSRCERGWEKRKERRGNIMKMCSCAPVPTGGLKMLGLGSWFPFQLALVSVQGFKGGFAFLGRPGHFFFFLTIDCVQKIEGLKICFSEHG